MDLGYVMPKLGGCVLMLLLFGGCSGGADDVGSAKSDVPGEQTYQRYCFSCHASGVSGAPPIGNAAAWAPRLAQGEQTLLQHAVEGMPSAGMPPRGMCLQCTDQDLRDAIHYMTAPR
jgi:cytochrome c5